MWPAPHGSHLHGSARDVTFARRMIVLFFCSGSVLSGMLSRNTRFEEHLYLVRLPTLLLRVLSGNKCVCFGLRDPDLNLRASRLAGAERATGREALETGKGV